MKTIGAIALALSIGACANIDTTGDAKDDAKALAAFAVDDLKYALADAKEHDDQIAAMCWADLLKSAERLQAIAERPNIGVAQSWQIARNARRNQHEACDAIVNDAKSSLFKIASRLGVAIPGL